VSREFKVGLTWRALFAIITAALLFIPINLYLNLVTGGTIAIAALYVIAILFSELSRIAGSPLTMNEIFVIYSSMGAVVASLPPYYWLVYRAFYVNTPVTFAFKIHGVPLPYLVPDWLAPPYGDPAYHLRTLMHPAWAKAIAVSTAFFLLTLLADVSLGILFSYLFVEVEKLPFPFAQIDYSLIETITERRSEHVRMFLAGFYPGLIYGALLYTGQALGVQIIPLPWADLTWLTEKYMPGALIGFATDPSSFVLGMMLDPSTTGLMLLGSATVWIFLNYLFTVDPRYFPVWAQEYYKGMTIATIYQRSFQRIWIAPQFGIALGLAAGLVIALRKSIVRTFKLLVTSRGGARPSHFPPFTLVLAMFLVGSLGSVALHHMLIPEVPLYISLLTSTVISFFIAMIASRAIGEIGFFPPMPWPWQAIVYFTPYEGYAGWVQAPYISLGTQGSMCQAVKVAYLTQTRPTDYFKALVIGLVLNAAVGFLMMDFFWRLAPIPSSAYPNSMVYWPLFATNDSLFATRQIVLDPKIMGIAAAIALGITASTPLLSKVGIASPVPLLIGCYMLPPYSIMMFIGSLVGRYVIRRYVGAERWNRLRGVLAAGILAGVGVFIGVGIALLLVARAAWVWPW